MTPTSPEDPFFESGLEELETAFSVIGRPESVALDGETRERFATDLAKLRGSPQASKSASRSPEAFARAPQAPFSDPLEYLREPFEFDSPSVVVPFRRESGQAPSRPVLSPWEGTESAQQSAPAYADPAEYRVGVAAPVPAAPVGDPIGFAAPPAAPVVAVPVARSGEMDGAPADALELLPVLLERPAKLSSTFHALLAAEAPRLGPVPEAHVAAVLDALVARLMDTVVRPALIEALTPVVLEELRRQRQSPDAPRTPPRR